MRTLERYLNRRGVANVDEWLAASGLTTYDKLVTWCKNNDIFQPENIYHSQTVAPPAEPIIEGDATWHVPAAERPRKSSTRKRSKTKVPKAKQAPKK